MEDHGKLEVILEDGAYMPERGHEWDAGLDLRSRSETVVFAHNEAHIDFGVHVRIPHGYYGRLETKSGLNFRYSLDIPGGIIDSEYTGPIKTVVYNRSDYDYTFKRGDKVCQLVICPCETPVPVEVTSFPETDRGASGFGSTGR